VSAVGATLAESVAQVAEEPLQLEIEVANVGDVPVNAVDVREARLDWAGLDLALDFSLDPGADVSAIAPGETRSITFDATLFPLGLCTRDLAMQPNPHHGLVTMGATVVSSAGASALAGIDVAVTCTAPDAITCERTLASACTDEDTVGLVLDCAPDWNAALADRSLCNTAALELYSGCSGYQFRVISSGGATRAYFYDLVSGALVAVLAPGDNLPVCVAGPSAIVGLDACTPFGNAVLSRPPNCDTLDGGMPDAPTMMPPGM
jgi:hypothetical protein